MKEERKIEEEKKEVDGGAGKNPQIPPRSAKPPPPVKPPTTYANDKPILGSISEAGEKGASIGKGEDRIGTKGKSDAKGSGSQTKEMQARRGCRMDILRVGIQATRLERRIMAH